MFVNWKRLLLAVYRVEEQQQEILAELRQMRKQAVNRESAVQPFVEDASHGRESAVQPFVEDASHGRESAVQSFTKGAPHGRESAVQPFVEDASHDREPDGWLQAGIDNILSYSVGKKNKEGE